MLIFAECWRGRMP